MGCKENFQRNLRYFTEQAGYNRKSLCEELHVSYTTFSEWWTGRHLPKDTYLDRVAETLHVSVGALFDEQKETPRDDLAGHVTMIISKKPHLYNLLRSADRLPVDKAQFIAELIEKYIK